MLSPNKKPKIQCVTGKNANEKWHAWLEYNDLIIDITADQFNEIKDKVMIIPKSSELHNSYKYERKYQIINESILTGQAESEVYKILTKCLL